jgi:hypothetical protein
VELFKNPDEFPPELYIWNYEDESPKKLPNAKKDRDCDSVVSRYSNQSKICKEKDGYICLCCGFFGPEGLAMKCCHLYEIKAHEALTTVAERKDKLKSLKLVDINELRNLVTMCEKCHTRFDSHQIGIHPVDRRWIITDTHGRSPLTLTSHHLKFWRTGLCPFWRRTNTRPPRKLFIIVTSV